MPERVQRKRVPQREEAPASPQEVASTPPAVDYDALLDQIDAVLETDAQAYVRSFVQKGGQ